MPHLDAYTMGVLYNTFRTYSQQVYHNLNSGNVGIDGVYLWYFQMLRTYKILFQCSENFVNKSTISHSLHLCSNKGYMINFIFWSFLNPVCSSLMRISVWQDIIPFKIGIMHYGKSLYMYLANVALYTMVSHYTLQTWHFTLW